MGDCLQGYSANETQERDRAEGLIAREKTSAQAPGPRCFRAVFRVGPGRKKGAMDAMGICMCLLSHGSLQPSPRWNICQQMKGDSTGRSYNVPDGAEGNVGK
jgi:hypothetical protein